MKLRNNQGFVLPLSLILMLVIMIMSLWTHRNVIMEIWGTIAHKRALDEFTAAEAGLRWAVGTYFKTGAVDALNEENKVKNFSIEVPAGEKDVQVNITVEFLKISNNCGFKSQCCRLFLLRAQTEDRGPLVKAIVVKDIPNPENDDQARHVCVM